jgi:hypothetical protein
MPKNISKPLEVAILELSTKEKDKLLLRLIAKDITLVEQLQVKLLEDESDIKHRKEEIKSYIDRSAVARHYSAGLMMMGMRDISGYINHHAKVTKDKFGEIELQLHLLLSFFEHQEKFMETYSIKADSLAEYVAKRTETILKKVKTLHEDYHIEYERDVNKLLKLVHSKVSAPYAKKLNLPTEFEL